MVAVGEVGYDSMTKEEDEAFTAQLQLALAHDLPVLVHTPTREKVAGTRRSIDVVRKAGVPPERVVVDHLCEVSARLALDSGCWVGFSVYPETSMDPERVVRLLRLYGTERVLVSSAADWGRSSPLYTRRTGEAMIAAGFSPDDVDRVLWRNPVSFYAQSGRLELAEAGVAADVSSAGSPVPRGMSWD